MASVTSWTRLEPRTRDERLPAVQARIADPLWLLGRQWQLGEFQGEDAGSPIAAELACTVSAISRWAPSTPVAPGLPLPADVPLEVLVEAERTAGLDLRAALEAGRRLIDLLGVWGTEHAVELAEEYGPLPPPPDEPADVEAGRLRALARNRMPDARRLWDPLREWRSGGATPAVFGSAGPTAGTAVDTWLDWMAERPARGGTAPDAWRLPRLEHEFSLAARTTGPGPTPAPAATETVLVATGHGGRELDWHAVDVWTGETMGALADSAPTTTTVTALPTRVSFPGMPAARWWEIEEGDVDLTALRPAPEDLGRLLLSEFALNYGNDLFWLPLDLPARSVTKVETLQVTTSFGDVITVPTTADADLAAHRTPAGSIPWAMFAPSLVQAGAATGRADLLVLLPGGGPAMYGEPLEDVLLSRDEMANMAWAVERTVPGSSGAPLDRHELWQRSRPDPEPAAGVPHDPALVYELATTLPPYWHPLLNQPGPAASNRSTVLALAAIAPPLGTLISPGFFLHEESLPRAGIRLYRHRRRTRATDGRVHVWTARRTEPGTGESTSGLRFDDLRGA
jgi:hypothetical protein